jgi:hypothetical protein
VDDIDARLQRLNEEFPLIPHTGAGRLYSTVRRMKAEEEDAIPIARRTGFAISVETGKRGYEMAEDEWRHFYNQLCGQLKRDYPNLYSRLFPGA